MKKVFALLVFLTLSTFAFGQNQTTASLTGVVTDASGAVVPGVKVFLTNPSTGVKFSVLTDKGGSYHFVDVPPGPGYKIVFSRDGFSAYQVTSVALSVANSITQNAKLLAGSTISVDVSAGNAGITLNTQDATVGNNIDVAKLNDLPVYDRTSGITTLFALQPGEVNGSTAGARVDQNNVTLDGLDVNDLATGTGSARGAQTSAGAGFAISGNAPVDSIEEFRGTVAGFGAGSGQGSGGQFSLITKSGTNQFHGNINEYHRDTDLTSNDFFSNLNGVPRSPLIRNQFGGNIGGPILRNKLFFFFNVAASRIIQNQLQIRTVPLDPFFSGQVGYVNSGPTCDDNSRANTTPTCITYLSKAQVAGFDPSGIGDSAPVATLLARYPHATDLTLGDGVNTGGTRFNAPTPDNSLNYTSRVDYVVNSKLSLFGRGSVTRENGTEAAPEFLQDGATSPFIDRSYSYVVGATWQISPTKTNQMIYGETKQNVAFPVLVDPEGAYNPIFFSGTTQLLSSPYTTPSSQARIIPIPLFTDNFTWQRGKHQIQAGGTFKWIHTHDSNGTDYNNVYVGLGGQTQSLAAKDRPADIFQSTTGAAFVNYDEGYTSQIGRVGNIEGTYNFNAAGQPLQQGSGSRRQYRYYQTELYLSDSWKVTPHLTLNYGLDYQLFSVPYEINGEESVPNTTFDKYLNARIAQSAAGQSGPTSVPFISYELGGKANSGAPLYQPQHNNFAPRVGFSYNPSWNPKTVFNGSMGLVYDRTIIQAIISEQDAYSYLFSQPVAVPFGSSADPHDSLLHCTTPTACAATPNAAGSPRVGDNLTAFNPAPPAVTTPYTPFVQQVGQTNGSVVPNPYGLANGGEFNISIDPSLKTPYSLMPTFGVQHEFHGGFIAKATYVGRFGRRLLAQADANQLVDFNDPASGQGLGAAFGNITKAMRVPGTRANTLAAQPWFENQTPAGLSALCQPIFGVTCTNNTQLVAVLLGSLVNKGDFADSVQALAANGLINDNVGMGSQFSENTFFTNKGFSSYNALLATLSMNKRHGLQFDANYTYGHSIDNVSLIANSSAFTGYGFVCDVIRPRECRAESDFDVKHTFNGSFNYDLPIGRGRDFVSNMPWYVDELIGGWSVSSIITASTGQAYGTVSSAFVASYSNDAPAILVGSKSALAHHVHEQSGGVNLYANPIAAAAAFTGPVGFQIGSRNNLRGPDFWNVDMGLGKTFALLPAKHVDFKFRADAFNVLNHQNFTSGGTQTSYDDVTNGSEFGNLTATQANSTGVAFRILQVSGRIEF